MGWAQQAIRPFRQLGRRFWLTFLAAVIIAEGIEALLVHSQDHSGVIDSVITATGIYQRLVTAPRQPIVRYTAVVEIDPLRDIPTISRNNVCLERAFLAHLLDRVSEAGATMIVVDKFFGKRSCQDDDAGTRALLEVIARIRAKQGIVVVGLRAQAGGAQSFIVDRLAFGTGDWSSQEGIINIADDNRKLPLQWRIYANEAAATNNDERALVVRDTLALTAAKLHNPNLLVENKRLAAFMSEGLQPFIGFIGVDQYRPHWHAYASEVVCGRKVQPEEDWSQCLKERPPPGNLQRRIVLIGENDPDGDEHRTIIGRVPGFYLQANYIEALLDDRLYRPAGRIVDIGFSFLFVLAFELILTVLSETPVVAALLLGGLFAVSYLILYLVIMHWSIYIDPLVGITAIVIKSLHLIYGIAHRAKHPVPG